MKKLKLLLILSFVSLIIIPTALGSTAPIVYVATDGSGDYNCDGTADEVQINQATAFVNAHPEYDTVYIKAGNYEIADTVRFYSNMDLQGAGVDKTIITLVDECGFPQYQSLFEPATRAAHNFKIHDFQIDGNYFSQTYVRTVYGEPAIHGRSFMDGIGFRHNGPNGDLSDPYDFEIYNMEMHHIANDGLKINGDGKPANMNIHDNEFYWTGHDDIYIHGADGVFIHDNLVSVLNGDCGFRIENTDNVVITNNVMQTDPSALHGLSAIYLSLTGASYTCQNYDISYNEIKTHQEFGVVVCNRVTGTPALDKASDLYIHHNLIYDSTGYGSYSGGIQINGWDNTVIENNVIDSSEGDGIITRNRFGMGTTTGYKIYIRNNIITGTNYNSGFSSSGYGINNYLASRHDLILDNNNIWNNEKGNYRNVGSSSSDFNVDPLFVDRANHDYHLRSDSPLINAGIGPYADGDFTPSTPSTPPTPSNAAPVLSSIGGKTATEGSALSFVITASDADGDSLMYSASGLPTGATFNGASRTFSWTPDVGQAGTYGVTFEVTDGEFTDSEIISIIVSPEGSSGNMVDTVYINRLRESTPETVITADGYVDVGNIDGVGSYRDVMWFDLSDYEQTDTVTSATLSLSWYYPQNAPRNQDTVVEVYRAADWEHSEVSWNEKSSGRPWDNAGGDWFDRNGAAQGSVPYASITFSGSDVPDNGNYEFDVTELVQDYVSGEHANTGFFIKARNEHDNYIAFDGTGSVNEVKKPKLKVTHSTTSNLAPVMDPIGDKTIDEGSTLNFIVTASDADGDSLTYSATGLPVGATFDTTSGEFTWTPSDVPAGTYGVRFEVTDGELADSKAIFINVNAISNDPLNNLPVITAFSPANDAVFEEGDVINIGVTASDVDGQELTYLLKIDGVIVSTTSSYVWTTDKSHDGTHTIEAVVSDGTDQVTSQHVLTVIKILPRWDVNKDGVVNILDVTIVAQNLGTDKPHPSWDVNQDGEVNIQDLTIVAHYFGETIE
ncbi:Putative Ig domain-containing protein [Methanococcoides vulcani]|uniref:Probable pectate lyase C n=1 Tax=Methanococcoides vulcani TaxID=1353158 RepID=A0A1H9Z812_9EURY|nr:disaggregatase related repeat-containing protein [Methanococcoides vulcani]SES77215.1 Putative Ig domain-containing protein [Methanococcoides vulcani]